eukprot:664315-Hanusia_phi.AAC.1
MGGGGHRVHRRLAGISFTQPFNDGGVGQVQPGRLRPAGGTPRPGQWGLTRPGVRRAARGRPAARDHSTPGVHSDDYVSDIDHPGYSVSREINNGAPTLRP